MKKKNQRNKITNRQQVKGSKYYKKKYIHP